MVDLSLLALLLILIKVIEFELSPHKVRLFRILFHSPPKPALEQALD